MDPLVQKGFFWFWEGQSRGSGLQFCKVESRGSGLQFCKSEGARVRAEPSRTGLAFFAAELGVDVVEPLLVCIVLFSGFRIQAPLLFESFELGGAPIKMGGPALTLVK